MKEGFKGVYIARTCFPDDISDLTCAGKLKRVLWHYIGKVVLLLGFLYMFICSLSFLGDAFKLLGGKILRLDKLVYLRF